jgi:hypothetical protein
VLFHPASLLTVGDTLAFIQQLLNPSHAGVTAGSTHQVNRVHSLLCVVSGPGSKKLRPRLQPAAASDMWRRRQCSMGTC